MWLLKNFIGHFSLKCGVYVSFVWNLVLCVLAFVVAEGSLFVSVPEIFAGIIILVTIYEHPNSPSSYFGWIINQFVIAAIFLILIFVTFIFYAHDHNVYLILLVVPILATIYASEVYFSMITWSLYYNLKHQSDSNANSKEPSNKGLDNVIVHHQCFDARSNRTLLPMQQAMEPSCPSSSSYFYIAPDVESGSPSVHPSHLPYPIQPAFNPELRPQSRFS